MKHYRVARIIEETPFRNAVDRMIRIGLPHTEIVLRFRIDQMKEELTRHHAQPLGMEPHSDLDGSYVVEREGVRIRYSVTLSRMGFAQRFVRKWIRKSSPQTVCVWLHSIDWPEFERYARIQ